MPQAQADKHFGLSKEFWGSQGTKNWSGDIQEVMGPENDRE